MGNLRFTLYPLPFKKFLRETLFLWSKRKRRLKSEIPSDHWISLKPDVYQVIRRNPDIDSYRRSCVEPINILSFWPPQNTWVYIRIYSVTFESNLGRNNISVSLGSLVWHPSPVIKIIFVKSSRNTLFSISLVTADITEIKKTLCINTLYRSRSYP